MNLDQQRLLGDEIELTFQELGFPLNHPFIRRAVARILLAIDKDPRLEAAVTRETFAAHQGVCLRHVVIGYTIATER